jgi:serine/threonine-protein kinase HipA
MEYKYCLSDGSLLKDNSTNGWSLSSIKKMFGVSTLPTLDITPKILEEIASEQVNKKYTVPGVQTKLSLGLSANKKEHKLTIVNYPIGYILKPKVGEDYPEGENLVMVMADLVKIQTVPHGLIELNNHSLAYLTKRIDRNELTKYPMEDFCQLSKRLTEDKYNSSYERCKKIISQYSSQVIYDETELFIRLVFCFLTCNSDMHLKNFSLIFKDNQYRLSEAYDMLPVNVLLPNDKEETALTLNGKKKNLHRKDFLAFAASGNGKEVIAENVANKLIDKLLTYKNAFLEEIDHSYMCEKHKKLFKEMMIERFERLS